MRARPEPALSKAGREGEEDKNGSCPSPAIQKFVFVRGPKALLFPSFGICKGKSEEEEVSHVIAIIYNTFAPSQKVFNMLIIEKLLDSSAFEIAINLLITFLNWKVKSLRNIVLSDSELMLKNSLEPPGLEITGNCPISF